jgi:hypothetical protein
MSEIRPGVIKVRQDEDWHLGMSLSRHLLSEWVWWQGSLLDLWWEQAGASSVSPCGFRCGICLKGHGMALLPIAWQRTLTHKALALIQNKHISWKRRLCFWSFWNEFHSFQIAVENDTSICLTVQKDLKTVIYVLIFKALFQSQDGRPYCLISFRAQQLTIKK